jgi:signal transduction histidine kinase
MRLAADKDGDHHYSPAGRTRPRKDAAAMSLTRRLLLSLLPAAVLVVVELMVGWTAVAPDRSTARLLLVAVAAGALASLAWVGLGWSRRLTRPLRESSAALRRTLADPGAPGSPADPGPPAGGSVGAAAGATADEVVQLREEVRGLLARLERHQARQRRREQDLAHQRDLALAAASDGVVLLDDHGAVIAANATARTVLGGAATAAGTVLREAELAPAVAEALAPLLEPPAPPDPFAVGPVRSDAPGDASALGEITHDLDGSLAIYRPERHDHGRLLVLRDVTDEHRFASTGASLREVMLEPRPVCLVELLRATLTPLARQAEEQGITLRLPASEDRQVLAVDPVKLPWVITVIVGNALRYTGRLGEVSVEVERRPDAMAVTVRDTGAGMAPEQLDRVFAPAAAPDGRRPAPGAQGLALAIAREIVAAHGGWLEADSKPGIGTEVQLVLPLETAPAGA